MIDRTTLKPGAFYWVVPTHDVDAGESWENEPQPARFVGYENGEEGWIFLNDEINEWPVAGVFAEIVGEGYSVRIAI